MIHTATRIALGTSLVVALLAACASVADLDVRYQPEVNGGPGDEAGPGLDGGSDGGDRMNVRPSTVEVLDASRPPREAGIVKNCVFTPPDDAGEESPECDVRAGRGCCLRSTGPTFGTATCIEQADLGGDLCPDLRDTIFIGCLASEEEIPCCWSQIGNTRVALPCADGGTLACLVAEDCPKKDCVTTTCSNGVTFGECGGNPTCR